MALSEAVMMLTSPLGSNELDTHGVSHLQSDAVSTTSQMFTSIKCDEKSAIVYQIVLPPFLAF